jgi:hypothetical protein
MPVDQETRKCWFCERRITGHAHAPGPAHCGCPTRTITPLSIFAGSTKVRRTARFGADPWSAARSKPTKEE